MLESELEKLKEEGKLQEVVSEQSKPELLPEPKPTFEEFLPWLEALRKAQPAVTARIAQSGAQQVVSGFNVTAWLNNQTFAQNVTCDVATNFNMTITEAGYYFINGSVQVGTLVVGAQYVAEIQVNTSAVAKGMAHAGAAGTDLVVKCSTIKYLNVGDTVRLNFSQNGGANCYIGLALSGTFLELFKL